MAESASHLLSRVFSASLRKPMSSQPLRCICKRNLSKSQVSDARKLRAMVVGLGNLCIPDTRHSVGMLVVDSLAKQLGALWHSNRRSLGHVAVADMNNQQLVLLKPTLLMNVSGKSIARTAGMYNISPSNVILVHDDLDKPVGKYSIKQGGSAGGHNGVRSAIACLRSDVMKRVRVGIGRPDARYEVKSYVLEKFDNSEIPAVEDTVEKCCKVLMDELQLLMVLNGCMSENTEHREKTVIQRIPL